MDVIWDSVYSNTNGVGYSVPLGACGNEIFGKRGGAGWRQGTGEMAGVWGREGVQGRVVCPVHMHAGMRRKEMWVGGYGVHFSVY